MWPYASRLKNITPHQRAEYHKATRGGVIGVLGGSPGCGKTFVAAQLIAKLIQQFGVGQIAVGCPTGKAAVRISEAMDSYDIPLRARTWHSLLGVGSVDEQTGNWGFQHYESKPLPFKVLIGDESSMIDTNLMCAIFRARAAGTHVLLVGDINQLPPVGHGAPLRDLIAAGLPYGELREIKRNSGGIVEACAAIRDGKRWKAGDNLVVHDVHPESSQVRYMLAEIEQSAESGLDPIWDCQVVVAVNEKSKLSRKELNKTLQAELNRNPAEKGSPFRMGDKIVNTKNGYFPAIEIDQDDEETTTNDKGEVYVANGELAEVLEVQEKMFIARLTNPMRKIRIPRGRSQGNQDEEGDGDNSDKTSSTGCSWDLGYALSVHKSQGSEWPVVVVMIDEYPGARMVCSREWIYTAISRAKQRCVLVGKKATADRFCKRIALDKRKTFLREQILRMSAERVLVEL